VDLGSLRQLALGRVNPAEYDALFQTEDNHWWFRGLWRDVAEALERFAPKRPGGLSWLDAGSGTGGLLARLSGGGGFRLAAGLELSADGMALCRRRGLPSLVRGSVSSLPFASGSFDAITSIDVLCHREAGGDRALAEAARCLSPGGALILQVPAYQWLMSAHDRAVWSSHRFSRAEVRGQVEAAGLEIKLCVYRNSLLFPLAAGRRLLSRGGSSGPDRSDVGPASRVVNVVGSSALAIESALRRVHVSAPFGLSVFCAAIRSAKL
jgi:SAM-dependent methyltransferase